MFDKPQYLTGKENPYVNPGDTFWIHNARLDGTTAKFSGEPREQAKLQVSRTRDGEKSIVFTSGRGIIGQVRRMDDGDRAAMPIEVRLDQLPNDEGNPTAVLTPAGRPPASTTATSDEIPF
jgi:hypothetical protein